MCYLAGPNCTMHRPEKVADILSVERCREQWPLIPEEELVASAVDFRHGSPTGESTSTKVLMHKRRVGAAQLLGDSAVPVCRDCHAAFMLISSGGFFVDFLEIFP